MGGVTSLSSGVFKLRKMVDREEIMLSNERSDTCLCCVRETWTMVGNVQLISLSPRCRPNLCDGKMYEFSKTRVVYLVKRLHLEASYLLVPSIMFEDEGVDWDR